VDTLWTLTSLLEYYTKTFIDAIMKLSTNYYYTFSFIIVNLLAFCQAWSINEYVIVAVLLLNVALDGFTHRRFQNWWAN